MLSASAAKQYIASAACTPAIVVTAFRSLSFKSIRWGETEWTYGGVWQKYGKSVGELHGLLDPQRYY